MQLMRVLSINYYLNVHSYPACFVEGTRITTPEGYAAVETLQVGDLVLSARRQRAVPVQWVGSRHVICARGPDAGWTCPVRIGAGAFGPGQPARDLFLSPDHAVFAEGVLIPGLGPRTRRAKFGWPPARSSACKSNGQPLRPAHHGDGRGPPSLDPRGVLAQRHCLVPTEVFHEWQAVTS